MLLFDLACLVTRDGETFLTAYLWNENNKNIIIDTIDTCDSLDEVCIEICTKYPEHFPLKQQLFEELIAVNNYNTTRGHNSFDETYPDKLYVS